MPFNPREYYNDRYSHDFEFHRKMLESVKKYRRDNPIKTWVSQAFNNHSLITIEYADTTFRLNVKI